MNDSALTSYEVDNTGGTTMPEQAGEGSNGLPAYDPNGNLTYYKGWVYTYDAQNRLRTASNNGTLIATYYYDGKNRQIARSISNVIRFSVWDGWELIEEYSAARTAAYLQGATGAIKSLLNNVYYYQDKLGSTTHIANASGALLEGYRYDLYGAPTYYDANGQPKATQISGHGVVDLYAGERWVSELGLYDLRNRFMSPELGRFLQPDPIGFKGDASNLYRYCANDPTNKTDPMGLYKIDTRGLRPEQVKQLQEAQKETADLVANAAARVHQALEAGADSKEFKSVKEGYEKVNGKGSATEKNLREFTKTARKMETALRDDGTKGYVMTAQSQDWFVKKWSDARVLGDGDVGGKRITINVDKVFKSKSVLRWTIGHESAHNAGVVDYWYKHQPEYHTVMTTQESLENADSYMDFITGR